MKISPLPDANQRLIAMLNDIQRDATRGVLKVSDIVACSQKAEAALDSDGLPNYLRVGATYTLIAAGIPGTPAEPSPSFAMIRRRRRGWAIQAIGRGPLDAKTRKSAGSVILTTAARNYVRKKKSTGTAPVLQFDLGLILN